MTDENAARFRPETDDVFGRIAHRYDLLCDLFSLGSHRRWKHVLACKMVEDEGRVVLDVAAGTGHIVHRLARRLARQGKSQTNSLHAVDLSSPMLDVARRKGERDRLPVTYEVMNAYDLHGIADASVDILSIAFGMKIMDRARVMPQVARVLKPGGVYYCLEAARIPWPWLHRLYLTYMDFCLPVMARVATGGDASAYDYLLRGIHGFPDQQQFCRELESYGFRDVSYHNMSLGIVALHRAVRC